MADGYLEREKIQDLRFAKLAVTLANATGNLKRPMKIDDYLGKPESPRKKKRVERKRAADYAADFRYLKGLKHVR